MFHGLLAQLVRDSKVPQAGAQGEGGGATRIYLHQKGNASMAFNNEQNAGYSGIQASLE